MNKQKIPVVPDLIPRCDYGVLRSLAHYVLRKCGWNIIGELPQQPKFTFAVAPHTSNWDFFVAIAVMFSLNLKVSFLGKASIFKWPIKSLLTALGGIAIDRSHCHGVVGQIVDVFKRNEQFVLGLAPEGTRRKTTQWKTGFLHIAKQAHVPVVPVSIDFAKRQVRFHLAVIISADVKQELAAFQQIFSDVCAKNPQAA